MTAIRGATISGTTPPRRAFVLGVLAFAGGARDALARDRAGEEGTGSRPPKIFSISYWELAELDDRAIRQLVTKLYGKHLERSPVVTVSGFPTGIMSHYILMAVYVERARMQRLMRDMAPLDTRARREARLRKELSGVDRSITRMKTDIAGAKARSDAHAAQGATSMARLTNEAIGEDEKALDRLTDYRFFIAKWLGDPMQGLPGR